jgi:hypothetical protein
LCVFKGFTDALIGTLSLNHPLAMPNNGKRQCGNFDVHFDVVLLARIDSSLSFI